MNASGNVCEVMSVGHVIRVSKISKQGGGIDDQSRTVKGQMLRLVIVQALIIVTFSFSRTTQISYSDHV
jgi:hypothetical protein